MPKRSSLQHTGRPLWRPALRSRAVAGIVSAALAVAALTACSHPSPEKPAATPSAKASGDVRHVTIGQDGSVRISLAGVGSLTGGPGSVTPGRLNVTPLLGEPNAAAAVPTVAGGPGMDVETANGSNIEKPLTLSLDAKAPRKGLVPVIAHHADNGRWNYLVPRWNGSTATVSTKQFSPNFLGWIDPVAALKSMKQKALDYFTGHQPAPKCRGGTHSWSRVSQDNDMVYSCLTSNDDTSGQRAELQLYSDRSSYIQVNIPAGVDYVWVDGESTTMRRLIATAMQFNAARTVLLPPGGWMTMGWRRPAQTSDPEVTLSASNAAMAMSLLTGTLTSAGLKFDGKFEHLWPMVANCLREDGGVKFAGGDIGAVWDIAKCMTTETLGNLTNPTAALANAQEILGPGADTEALQTEAAGISSTANALQDVGIFFRALVVVNAVRNLFITVFGSLSDDIIGLVGQGDHVDLNLTAAPVAATPPAVHNNPAPSHTTPPPSTGGSTPPPSSGGSTPPPSTSSPQGFFIEDDYYGGTWARTDPNDGTWYSESSRPANAAYWYHNGLGVAVDCARTAAPYVVRFPNRTETWTTWFHVTDGKWYPSAASQEPTHDGLYGLPAC